MNAGSVLIRCFCCFVVFLFATTEVTASDKINFNRDVRSILADNCFECHGPDEESREGDLRLDVLDDALESVIEPGNPDGSALIERLLSEDENEVMPPPESKRRPTARQIEVLRQWVAQGAPYERHWAFVAPKRPKIPSVFKGNPMHKRGTDSSLRASRADASGYQGWPRNAIDPFVLAHLDSQSLKPRPDADPRVLARRLSLALTGLPVLPERSDRFAAAYDSKPEQAISDLVDELLASIAYGEHFAWGWMDAARYADTNGYQADGYRIMWPWRDWLVRNLNANLPFDKMTEQMLAGDLLLPENQREWQSADWIADDRSSELLTATGFLRNHRYDTGSGTIPAESKFENAADRMETVGTVWMGLTMLCARCHTHKYDPIENREYYELLSFFDDVRETGSALRGASHPYIRTPTNEQRAELKRLRKAASKTKAALDAASERIGEAQAVWEFEVAALARARKDDRPPSGDGSYRRVTRGLKFHYAAKPLRFDGSTSIKKSNKPIALCAGSKRWTISFWFRPESEGKGAIFSSVEEPDRYRPGIQADWINGNIRVRHVCRWVNSYIEYQSKETLATGRWYHVTFRSDGRMQGIAYSASLDGDDEAMTCTHPVTNDAADKGGKAPLVLGGSPFLPGFIGELRDLRFYDRELKSDEVQSLADARSTARIAAIPVEQRTQSEAATLRLAFLDNLTGDPTRERGTADEEESLAHASGYHRELRNLWNATLEARKKLDEAIRSAPTTMVMKEGRTKHTRVRMAGVFDSLGDRVETGTPAFLPPLDVAAVARRRIDTGKVPAPDHGLATVATRLDLARWLTHPDHPLTARVAVNRIWQSLWGRGFVDSPENFGTQTAEPLHADLLDWLATEYVGSGWDTKALIKLIVTSRTYRQSSDASEEMWASDPTNKHLARGPRYRLPVHTVRDQALFLSGRLDNTIGGPPVIVDEVIGQNGKPVELPFEKSGRRRTLYTFWKRNSPHPMLAVFDVADRNQCEVRTMRTNTPLQAPVTLNEPGFAAAAEALGERARKVGHASSLPMPKSASRMLTPQERQLRWVWQACTGRLPDREELRQLRTTLRDYVEIAEGNKAKAWTALCNVLLNLDATLTLE